MALNVKWSKIISFLKYPIRTFKQWRNRKNRIIVDVNIGSVDQTIDDNIILVSENIDNEVSITQLEYNIEALEKRKNELSKKAKNKYNYQLDQLLNRANARLRKLKELTFDELDLERLLIEQKILLTKKVNGKIVINPIDFYKIRNQENIISNIDFKAVVTKPKKNEIVISKEAEEEISDLLEELFIDVEPDVSLLDWQPIPETSIGIVGKGKSKIYGNESSEIIDYFKNNGIVNFYHVTNFKNIESIESSGLFSWSKLDKLKVKYYNELTDGVSKSLDIRKGKQDFVRLSICKATPMFYAKSGQQTNIIYSISVECLKECKFEFSDMNGTDNNVKFGATLQFLKENIRLDLTKSNYNRNWPALDRKKYQAEILIKEHIPAKYIISKQPL